MQFERLRAWRADATNSGRLRSNELRDIHLKRLTTATSIDDVRSRLPVHLQPLTLEVATALGLAGHRPAGPVLAETSNDPAPVPSPMPPAAPSPSLSPVQPRPTSASVSATGLVGSANLAPAPASDLTASLRFAYTDLLRLSETPPPQLEVAQRDDGTRYSWQPVPTDQPVVIYRVVSSDVSPPYSPDHDEVIALTRDCHFEDVRPLTNAVRYVQVWQNSGSTVDDAINRQPVRAAESQVVAQVSDIHWDVTSERVAATWEVPDDVESVRVSRVPADRVRSELTSPEHGLDVEHQGRHGVVDRDVRGGQRYVYVIWTEVKVGDEFLLSPPVLHPVVIPIAPVPVTDLRYRPNGDAAVDLTWQSPPAGRVTVYLTASPPPNALRDQAIPVTELAQYLPDQFKVPGFASLHDGQALMTEVAWPRNAQQMYITPVTVAGGQAIAGPSHPAVRVGRPGRPVIVERVDQQYVKLGWPIGATSLQVQVGPPEGTPGGLETLPDITREQYQRTGGFQFDRKLPTNGCRVVLTGVKHSGAQRNLGMPLSLAYPGLMQLEYTIEIIATGVRRNHRHAVIKLRAREPVNPWFTFYLLHHPSRLPLHPGDGRIVYLAENTEDVAVPAPRIQPSRLDPVWSDTGWRADLDELADTRHRWSGYLRLFVRANEGSASTNLALLDPPLTSLTLR